MYSNFKKLLYLHKKRSHDERALMINITKDPIGNYSL